MPPRAIAPKEGGKQARITRIVIKSQAAYPCPQDALSFSALFPVRWRAGARAVSAPAFHTGKGVEGLREAEMWRDEGSSECTGGYKILATQLTSSSVDVIYAAYAGQGRGAQG